MNLVLPPAPLSLCLISKQMHFLNSKSHISHVYRHSTEGFLLYVFNLYMIFQNRYLFAFNITNSTYTQTCHQRAAFFLMCIISKWFPNIDTFIFKITKFTCKEFPMYLVSACSIWPSLRTKVHIYPINKSLVFHNMPHHIICLEAPYSHR